MPLRFVCIFGIDRAAKLINARVAIPRCGGDLRRFVPHRSRDLALIAGRVAMLCCGPTQNDRNVIPDAVTELGEGWPGTAQARLVQEALRDAEKFRCGFDADILGRDRVWDLGEETAPCEVACELLGHAVIPDR